MMWRAVARSLAACLAAFPLALTASAPDANAEPDPVVCNPYLRNCADNAVVGAKVQGDTHITGTGIQQTIDCNQSTLLVNGSYNTIYAVGSCWAVTMQGSSNMVIADNIVNDVTVYGNDQTVLYKSGEPIVLDRGRQLGMVNHIDRVAT
jgi:Protein of unknown function (DUF3060)